MSQIRRKLHVKDPLYISPIDYVQSSNLIPIVFELVDFELTDQMGASVLVIRPDKTFEYDPAVIDISENTITVQPTSTMFAVPGGNYLQVRIYGGEQQIQIAFDVLVRAARDQGSLSNIGVNIVPFVDQILAVNTDAAESAAAAAESEATAAELVRKLELETTAILPASDWTVYAPNYGLIVVEAEGITASSKIIRTKLITGWPEDYAKVTRVSIDSPGHLEFKSDYPIPTANMTIGITYI